MEHIASSSAHQLHASFTSRAGWRPFSGLARDHPCFLPGMLGASVAPGQKLGVRSCKGFSRDAAVGVGLATEMKRDAEKNGFSAGSNVDVVQLLM